jgi:hypothetical protein
MRLATVEVHRFSLSRVLYAATTACAVGFIGYFILFNLG